MSIDPLSDVRSLWLRRFDDVVRPVLENLAAGSLPEVMPVEAMEGRVEERRPFSCLEAVGRTLAGAAPWLEAGGLEGTEAVAQRRFRDWAVEGLEWAADPRGGRCLLPPTGSQPLVDAAFLCIGFMRAPEQLWNRLSPRAQENWLAGLASLRRITPSQSNWLLFAAAIELFLGTQGREWDTAPVDEALRRHEEWMLGDGCYGDGPWFHFDYYNSFVIHPFLIEIHRALARHPLAQCKKTPVDRWRLLAEKTYARAQRYAAIQERMISPEGTLPPLGRSLTYRFGILQLLGQAAWLDFLPAELEPAQVRGAMTAVMRRFFEAPGTFDEEGWLRIGLVGHQPGLAEVYISTGSLYLTATGFLPLGLPPDHPFWCAPEAPWTSKRIYAGEDLSADRARDI